MLDDMLRRGVIPVVPVRMQNGGVTVTFIKPHDTGSNEVVNEVGRTTAMSLGGTHYGPWIS
jgi:hypothetical protein